MTASLLLLRLRIATFDDVSAVNVAILLPLKALHPLLATTRLHIDVGQGELLGLLLVTGLRTALWLSHVHGQRALRSSGREAGARNLRHREKML